MKKALLWFGVFIFGAAALSLAFDGDFGPALLAGGLAFFLFTRVSKKPVLQSPAYESAPVDPLPTKSRSKRSIVQDFTVIDFETTGFAGHDRVVEIGAVKFRSCEPIDQYRRLVNPKRKIPAEATRVHGITNDMVDGQPTFYELIDEFSSFIGDDVILAHNAPFDMRFFRGYVDRHKKSNPDFAFELKNPVIDTLPIAREAFPKLPDHKLENLKKVIGMADSKSHTAIDDCLVAGKLYLKCMGCEKQ